MKKRTLLTCGLAAALFAGCSSDDKLTVDDGTVSNGGNGFLALNISLPSTNGGIRSNDAANQKNDQYNQGSSSEYKVQTIDLICFTDAADPATVQAFHYNATELSWSTPPATANGITTDAVLQVEPVKNTVKKVLVLVNAPSSFSIDAATGVLTYTKTPTGGGSPTLYTCDTYSDFKALELNEELFTSDKFFMCNAPLSKGSGDVTDLVSIQPKETMAEAMSDMRVVNVERAAGKVSMAHANSGNWNNWEYTIPGTVPGYAGDKVTFEKWVLNLTNKESYAIRHYNSSWEGMTETTGGERFYGAKTYIGNEKVAYGRTYWAEDVNYDSYNAADFNKITLTSEVNKGIDVALYCNENTFNVAHMKQQETTSVILKAKYKPAGKTIETDGNWYRLGNSNTAYVLSEINTKIAAISGCSGVTVNAGALEEGVNTIEEGIFNNLSDNTTTKAQQVADIKSTLGKITVFKDCYCYYAVRIQHFGSYYTPWGAEPSAPTIDETKFYDYTAGGTTYDNKYLGRYGVVRNNWYELELSTISAPGEPTVPDPSTKADDQLNYYIQANVKIMDWAVRKQSVNL